MNPGVRLNKRMAMWLPRIVAAATLALLPAAAHADWPTLANNTPLAFGSVIAGPTPGTVTISTAGVRTTAGGVVAYGAAGYNAATFTLTVWAGPNRNYRVILPANTTLTGPGTPMTVDTFTSNPSSGTATLWVAVPISVGATLHVGANQAAGSYSGTFTLTVLNP
jgi:hypothetical protein